MQEKKNPSNLLNSETSPYLLQHQANPVNWNPWKTSAFELAKTQNRPIFLSIGYSSCYWCHVMEKECFEDEQVAEVLNQHFISIKVDREERPDVDQIYMEAVQRLTGRGGWPMSVFLTPELKPFFGGTYFPKPNFLHLLDQINKVWTDHQNEVLKTADELTELLSKEVPLQTEAVNISLSETEIEKFLVQLQQSFDPEDGGFGDAPKFPQATRLSLLLRIHLNHKSPAALKMLKTTLDKMAQGGIYDQLGGGFHRYSTDDKWLVPHFEKMLYDNALLASSYLEAAQYFKSENYKQIGKEILDYVLSEMTDKKGGFYSAEDAGEVGVEGEFYVWTLKEIAEALSEAELNEFLKCYSLTEQGNFEHQTNILSVKNEDGLLEKNNERLKSARIKLLEIREKRNKPFKDDKVLCAWNGLMISAMAKGYQVIGDEKYLNAAQQAATFIKREMFNESGLLRSYRRGEAKFLAYLEDYAYLIEGLLNLFEADSDLHWLNWAIELQEKQNEIFWDQNNLGYFYSRGDDSSLISRKKTFADDATPSANAVSSLNLERLYHFTFNKNYRYFSDSLFKVMAPEVGRFPLGYPMALIALDFRLAQVKEVVIVGDVHSKELINLKFDFAREFLPYKVLAFKDSKTLDNAAPNLLRDKNKQNEPFTIYVCEEGACQLPTKDVIQAKDLVKR